MTAKKKILGDLNSIAQVLQGKKRILVTSHDGPDGDAVGATLALGMFIQSLGHEVTCFNADEIPEIFKFLPGTQLWQRTFPEGKSFDLTFVIDVFDLHRTGLKDISHEKLGKIIVLDHHLTQNPHGDLFFIDPNACAAGILVHRLAKVMKKDLSLEIAKNIYCCILTDSGSFRYSSTDEEAFQVAGEMVKIGATPWEFAMEIYENQPEQKVRLLTEVLKTLEISSSGFVAVIHVNQDTLERFQADPVLTDGFINFPRSISGVEVAIFLKEIDPNTYKASLRSIGNVDVREICSGFGGGGHRNAAGCTLKGSFDQVKKKILSAAQEYCQKKRD